MGRAAGGVRPKPGGLLSGGFTGVPIGVILGLYRGYIGIMENKVETII